MWPRAWRAARIRSGLIVNVFDFIDCAGLGEGAAGVVIEGGRRASGGDVGLRWCGSFAFYVGAPGHFSESVHVHDSLLPSHWLLILLL
jgi:hypothetical protein